MITLVLAAFAFLLTHPVFSLPGIEEPIEITEGWRYQTAQTLRELESDENGYKPLTDAPSWLPAHSRIDWSEASYLSLQVELPEPEERYRDPTVFIPRMYFVGEVYVGDQLVYEYGRLDASGRSWFRGADWHILPLPDRWRGQKLTMNIRSEYSVIGIAAPVSVGDRSDLMFHMIARDAPSVLISVFLLVLGLSTAVVIIILPGEIVKWLHARSGVVFLELGTGLSMLALSSVKTLVVNSDLFWTIATIIGSALLVIGGMLYIRDVVPGRGKRIFKPLMVIHGVIATITVAVFMFQVCTISMWLMRLRIWWYFLEVVIILVVLARTFWRYKMAFGKTIPVVLVGMVGITAHVVWTGEFTRYYGIGTRWGLAVLTVGSLTLIVRRIVHAITVASRYRKEYETVREETEKYVYADIHDHLGGNLTDLAIRLDRDGDHQTADAVRDNLQMLRGRLRALEDHEMLTRDFFLGLRLMIVRRYTSAGRRVWVDVTRAVEVGSPPAPQRRVVSHFHPIIAELITNDLKYGHGTSHWSVVASACTADWYSLEISLSAPTRYPLREGDPSPGHGTETIALRINTLRGEIILGPEIVPGSSHSQPIQKGCTDEGTMRRAMIDVPSLPVNGDSIFRFAFRVSLPTE